MSNYSIQKLTKNSSFHALVTLILIFITPFQLIAMQEPSKALGWFLDQMEHDTVKTALHLALYNKKDEVALFLIKTPGITLCISDDADNTPLRIATQGQSTDVIRALLEKAGADNGQVHPNATNNRGDTPLHIAAQEGHAKVIQELLKNDIIKNNPNKKNNEGNTPPPSRCWTELDQCRSSIA